MGSSLAWPPLLGRLPAYRPPALLTVNSSVKLSETVRLPHFILAVALYSVCLPFTI